MKTYDYKDETKDVKGKVSTHTTARSDGEWRASCHFSSPLPDVFLYITLGQQTVEFPLSRSALIEQFFPT